MICERNMRETKMTRLAMTIDIFVSVGDETENSDFRNLLDPTTTASTVSLLIDRVVSL
jgi:hypothetical protein